MEKVIRRWYDLISINSVDGNEINAADYVSKELRGMGLEPHLSWFEGDTERRRPSVWTVLDSGKPGKTFLLIGHIDTVAVKPEQWRTDPFTPTLVDGKVYGRGAMDMKGGDAAVLTALEYFSEHREEFSGRIMACFVSDEEGLSQGTYGLVAEDVIHADYALMAECRYDNVAVGFRGRFSFEVTVKGKSGHASRYPEVGENALISAGKLAAAIEALPTKSHPKLHHGTWCVRRLEGGSTGALIVPDSCYMFVDRYVVPGETAEICISQIEGAAEELGLGEKVEVRLKPRKSPYMQSFAIPEDHPLVVSLRRHYEEVDGKPLAIEYDPSVCDSNILAVSLGIPVVTWGPSGGNMHGDNEWGVPYQVINALEVYKRIVRDMLPA
ncbi:MAG: M20/M25/M40 family metallo-hydrolase [Sutterellaceae bacterium]|nr:M20/M25/M40 family metallo-hydrolase [Sutterellaceae bacterium]MDD7441622.1 M20/M25/M40 family metallo-hydrolase [Sutterellaceae bacterium]MDY2868973.1 M20/M25/M40 family metallo-hydrolase [Mesosutterella sp.]